MDGCGRPLGFSHLRSLVASGKRIPLFCRKMPLSWAVGIEPPRVSSQSEDCALRLSLPGPGAIGSGRGVQPQGRSATPPWSSSERATRNPLLPPDLLIQQDGNLGLWDVEMIITLKGSVCGREMDGALVTFFEPCVQPCLILFCFFIFYFILFFFHFWLPSGLRKFQQGH